MRRGMYAVSLALLVATGCDMVNPDSDTNPNTDSDVDSGTVTPPSPLPGCFPVYPVTTDAITLDWSLVTKDFWGNPVDPNNLTEITLSNLFTPPEEAATRLCGDTLPFYGNDELESVAIVAYHTGTSIVLSGTTHSDVAPRGPVEGKTLIVYLMTDRRKTAYREIAIALAPLPGGSTTVTLE